MNTQRHLLSTALLVGAITAVCAAPALAQVAGTSTSVDVAVTETTQLAMGWSAKKTLLGKTIYDDSGNKIGQVEDLIISPERNVSYVITGAGGFIGIGRHDVAVPVGQMQSRAGRLVMPGATKDTIKALPTFTYADEDTRRDLFLAAADRDVALGRGRVSTLEKAANQATAEDRAKIYARIADLKTDIASAESQIDQMRKARVGRWRDFEASVSAATAKLRRDGELPIG